MTEPPSPELIRRACDLAQRVAAAHDRVFSFYRRLAAAVPCPYMPDPTTPEAAAEWRVMWERFGRRLARLTAAYDRVAGWWVEPNPPAFEPRATSTLAALVWWGLRLLHHAESARPAEYEPGTRSTALFVTRHCRPVEGTDALAEVARETRRRLGPSPELVYVPTPRRASIPIIVACNLEVIGRLPAGWEGLPEAERVSLLTADSRPRCPRPTARTGRGGTSQPGFSKSAGGSPSGTAGAGRPTGSGRSWRPWWPAAPVEVKTLGPNPRALADAVHELNATVAPGMIRFRCDGTGRGVRWVPAGEGE